MGTAVEMVKNGDNGLPVPNYTDENVSTKIVKLIQSYTGVVDKMVGERNSGQLKVREVKWPNQRIFILHLNFYEIKILGCIRLMMDLATFDNSA